ncbi:hypothetical protein DM02DRAFT_249030 [Periconia macrospinosa]|uniref:Uncharacterized protein n=1 Tax=Periconia macrospinosa TaxID=97972 RepID=A0A2V1D547_9PLEO|nr:hypothetical protein DM02DRAFT_249030 [Periconia macrospinosa]
MFGRGLANCLGIVFDQRCGCSASLVITPLMKTLIGQELLADLFTISAVRSRGSWAMLTYFTVHRRPHHHQPDGFPLATLSSNPVSPPPSTKQCGSTANYSCATRPQVLSCPHKLRSQPNPMRPKDALAWHAFTLEEQNGKFGLIYQGRYNRRSPIPSDAEPCSTPSHNGLKIELEGEVCEDTPDLVILNPFKSYVQVLALYNIQISTLGTSIANTLIFSEQFAEILHELECVQLVRPLPLLPRFLTEITVISMT